MATGVLGSNTEYVGVLFYEEEGDANQYEVTFTATKDKDTLLEYVQRKHPLAEIGPPISFKFDQRDYTPTGDYIELIFDAPQDDPTTGWTIEPHTVPFRIYRSDVDKFGDPDLTCYHIYVCALPGAVPKLHYAVPVKGVVEPVTLVINMSLRPSPMLVIRDLDYVLDTLEEAGFSMSRWKPLGSALGLHRNTLKDIRAQHPGDVQRCLRVCLDKWLRRVDAVNKGDTKMTSLCDALERMGERTAAAYIRENVINKVDPELRHYREALKKPVTCRLTKAVVQGEARVGKTAFRSLLLDEKYVKSSTGIAEPRVGIYCYRRDTGEPYKLLNATELEAIVKNALKKDAVQKLTNSPVENQVSDGIDGKKIPNGNESADEADEADDGFVDGNEAPDDGNEAPDDGNEASGDENETLLSKEVEKVLEEVQQCSGKENHLEGAQWLYLIDTGGQIAFQKLLPIFMPFAQVLILVVNISKEFSSQSTPVMHCEGEDYTDGSPYSLPVEEILKQIISSIASGMQHFRDSYKDDKVLCDLVPEKLQILPIGTHGDECSDLKESKRILAKKLAEIIQGNADCESIEINDLVHIREIDGRIASAAIEERRNDENYTNTKSSLDDVDKILKKKEKEINIPFFYYFFDIVLRAAAEEGCGVLELSTCISLGEDLKLSENEVLESLNFLHHINSIIYYHDSKACSDLVFVNIDSLIGILKELVGHVYKAHSDAEVYAGEKDGFIKGMLSESKFKTICGVRLDCIKKELKVDDIATKLLNLFVELSIATLINDKYFIPALLPVNDVTDINPFDNDRDNRVPLLFYFEKATPMGLFCSVITLLLSSSCYEITLTESNFSNYIELKYRTEGIPSFYIVLVEQVNCIEVHCEEQRGEGIIREDVKEVIASAAAKHNLSDSHRNPKPRFYCSCERGPDGGADRDGSAGSDGSAGTSSGGGVSKGKKHTVEVETVNKEHFFRCASSTRKIEDEDKKKLWSSWLDTGMPNTSTSNDEPAKLASSLKQGKELNMKTVTKIFAPFAHHYKLIGIGLRVEVVDLKDTATDNLITVFQRWFDAYKGISWDTLLQVCDDFPDQLGKAKAELNKELSTQRP